MGIADLSTHQNVVSSAFRMFSNRLYEHAGATEVQVSVMDGVQRGAERKLKVTGLRIGSGADADLMLMDDGVVNDHVVLSFAQSVFGVLVDATIKGDGVQINAASLEAGTELQAARLPLEIKVGNNVVRIARPGRTKKFTALQTKLEGNTRYFSRHDPVILLSVSGLLVLLCMAVASSLFQWHNRDYAVVVNDVTPILASRPAPTRNWVGELQAVTEGFELQDDLAYNIGAGGIIYATGNIPDNKVAALRNVQGWHDAQAGSPGVKWDIVRQVGLQTMPSVSLVKLSEPRGIVLASGTTAMVGDTLIEDWEIKEIGDLEMTLKRGSELTIVSYTELAK